MVLILLHPAKEVVAVTAWRSAVDCLRNAHAFFFDRSADEYKLILSEVGEQITYYTFTPLLSRTSINLSLTTPISECCRSVMIYNFVNESLRVIPNLRCNVNLIVLGLATVVRLPDGNWGL